MFPLLWFSVSNLSTTAANLVVILFQVTQTSLKIGEEEVKCQKMADLAQADLAEAMPALEEAKKALEALNKKVKHFCFNIFMRRNIVLL